MHVTIAQYGVLGGSCSMAGLWPLVKTRNKIQSLIGTLNKNNNRQKETL